MSISESTNIPVDSYDANLKACIQDYDATQNGQCATVIKIGITVMITKLRI